MLNVGVWGWGPKDSEEFVTKNRELEAKVRELGGMKWLYAHTYYKPDEFWQMYGGREWYDGLREKYKATTLPSVWDKVFVDPDGAKGKKRHWLKRQAPIAGCGEYTRASRAKTTCSTETRLGSGRRGVMCTSASKHGGR